MENTGAELERKAFSELFWLAGASSAPWLLPCAPGPALAAGEPTCSGAAADKPG